MWKLSRSEFSGESLAKEAAVLIAKWKTRGLTEAVLQAIRTDVFNVGVPVAPSRCLGLQSGRGSAAEPRTPSCTW